jgi:hypothetical protein
VSGLPAELPGRVTIRLVPHTEAEAKAQVKANDWRSHGAIVRRGSQVVYRAGDHRVNPYDIHASIVESLGWGRECRSP